MAANEPVIIGREMLLSLLTLVDSIRLCLDLMETKTRKELEMIRTVQDLTMKVHDSLRQYVPPENVEE